MNILYAILPTTLITLLMVIPISIIVSLFKYKNRKKFTPFSENMLRWPGKSLNDQIQELTVEIIGNALGIPLVIASAWGSMMTLIYLKGSKVNIITIPSIITVAIIGYFLFNLSKTYTKRNSLRLGFEAEIYVGQELNKLMLQNCQVFHDFPAGKFNIDHIVISPTGVFAIETKGRAKIKNEKSNESWKLSYDGKVLKFPTWTETEPINQATRQATWLSNWLSKAVGENIPVKPILAFPGWYIQRTTANGIPVYNGKNPSFLAKGRPELTAKLITRITHQIEQKCRDIESKVYRQKKEI